MKKTREEALVTKKQIVEKAVQLFLQKGFSDTTLDEIAQHANVTRGAIYWHFNDKLDIVNDLIEAENENMVEFLNRLFGAEMPPFRKIREIIEGIVDHFFENERFRNFIELTWFKIEYTQLANLKTTKAELTRHFVESFSLIVKEAQRVGEVKKDLDELEVAITMTNIINGMYRLHFLLPDFVNSRDEAVGLFRSYLNLIKAG